MYNSLTKGFPIYNNIRMDFHNPPKKNERGHNLIQKEIKQLHHTLFMR